LSSFSIVSLVLNGLPFAAGDALFAPMAFYPMDVEIVSLRRARSFQGCTSSSVALPGALKEKKWS
jgi:hypothetical protein